MALYTSDIQEQLRNMQVVLGVATPSVKLLREELEAAYDTLTDLLSEYGVDISEFYDD